MLHMSIGAKEEEPVYESTVFNIKERIKFAFTNFSIFIYDNLHHSFKYLTSYDIQCVFVLYEHILQGGTAKAKT